MSPAWLAKVLAEHRQVYTGSKWICWTCREDGPYIYDDDPDGNEAWSAHLAAVVWAEFTARAQQAREDVARSVRGTVRVGPFGPNSQAVNLAGGSVSLTPDEARDAADAAVAALLRAMGGAQ